MSRALAIISSSILGLAFSLSSIESYAIILKGNPPFTCENALKEDPSSKNKPVQRDDLRPGDRVIVYEDDISSTSSQPQFKIRVICGFTPYGQVALYGETRNESVLRAPKQVISLASLHDENARYRFGANGETITSCDSFTNNSLRYRAVVGLSLQQQIDLISSLSEASQRIILGVTANAFTQLSKQDSRDPLLAGVQAGQHQGYVIPNIIAVEADFHRPSDNVYDNLDPAQHWQRSRPLKSFSLNEFLSTRTFEQSAAEAGKCLQPEPAPAVIHAKPRVQPIGATR